MYLSKSAISDLAQVLRIVMYSLKNLNSLKSFLATPMFSTEPVLVWLLLVTLHAGPGGHGVLVGLALVLHEAGEVLDHLTELVPAVYKRASVNFARLTCLVEECDCLVKVHTLYV